MNKKDSGLNSYVSFIFLFVGIVLLSLGIGKIIEEDKSIMYILYFLMILIGYIFMNNGLKLN